MIYYSSKIKSWEVWLHSIKKWQYKVASFPSLICICYFKCILVDHPYVLELAESLLLDLLKVFHNTNSTNDTRWFVNNNVKGTIRDYYLWLTASTQSSKVYFSIQYIHSTLTVHTLHWQCTVEPLVFLTVTWLHFYRVSSYTISKVRISRVAPL